MRERLMRIASRLEIIRNTVNDLKYMVGDDEKMQRLIKQIEVASNDIAYELLAILADTPHGDRNG